ncbi:class I SAM-dependent methyltransferase [Fulvivirga aurantia]|uniref:class I SAM-dependent methyltransferase n=1 Tax=Fulvivirga aurantia TaxID=2529383 RepID=UPI001FE56B3A|nr:class I SAM-dependent methyltransferase [Fulvivirga aurantia]
MVAKSDFINPSKEKYRYTTHNNDVNDPGYQKFVSPITSYVLSNLTQNAKGLDYGAGPGPVITKLLRDQGYDITTYDPYFDNNQDALKREYDYIVCCEVMEHFHDPAAEFKFLYNHLLPGGHLICMTDLFTEQLNFEKWYYKNDLTHVFFYHEDSLSFIKENYGFRKLTVDNRLIVFEK